MTTLNVRELAAAPLLRAVRDNPEANNTVLAEQSGRIRGNMARDLANLEAAGWITRSPLALTAAGAAIVDLAPPPEPATAEIPAQVGQLSVDGIVGLLHAQIVPSHRNPRNDWDSEEAKEALAELAASIKAEGRILQNLVVRPAVGAWTKVYKVHGADGRELPLYDLVAGERRHRAVGSLIAAGDWSEDRPLPALVVELDDAGHDRVALIENLKRRDLKPLEEARAFRRLIDGGMKTAELAEIINTSQRLVQQRLQLLELDDKDQEYLDKGQITIEEARRRIAAKPVPIEITPEQALVFLELADAIARAGKGQYWHDLPIDYRTIPRLEAEGDLRWLDRWVYVGLNYSSGQSQIRMAYHARLLLTQLTGQDDLKAAAIAAPLKAARLAAAPTFDAQANPLSKDYDGEFAYRLTEELERDGRYMTDFLNGPFLIDPEKQKAAKERQRADAERQAGWAKEQADREAREQKRKAAGGLVRQLGLTFTAEAAPEPVQVTTTLEAFGHPLPWKWATENHEFEAGLLDANGEEINLYEGDDLLVLVMAAVNRTGGHQPVVFERPQEAEFDHAADPSDLSALAAADGQAAEDRPQFVSWIAEALQDSFKHWKAERCRSQAGHALDTYLKDGGIAFGDDGYAWDRNCAVSIADEFADTVEDLAEDADPGPDGDDTFAEDDSADLETEDA